MKDVGEFPFFLRIVDYTVIYVWRKKKERKKK